MKKIRPKFIAISALVIAAVAFIYYYAALPPINIHAPGFWKFIIFLCVVGVVLSALFNIKGTKPKYKREEVLIRKLLSLNIRHRQEEVF